MNTMNGNLPATAPRRCALLIATTIIAFAAPARAVAESHPSIEACIAYAEADAAYDAANQEANAAYHAAEQEAYAAYNAATNKAEAAFDAAKKEARAAYNAAKQSDEAARFRRYGAIKRARADRKAAKQSAKAAYNAVEQEAKAPRDDAMNKAQIALNTAYVSIYKEDGGKQSSVESVMVQLVDHDRAQCQQLYGI